MKQSWAKTELEAHWLLLPDEYRLLHEKMEKHRLAFAIMLKYLQYTGRFPEKFTEVPSTVINFLAEQLNLNVDVINHYELEERIVRDHKSIIRQFLGLNTVTSNDIEQIEEWLLDHVLSQENSIPAIESFVYNRLNEMRLVPLTKSQIEQCIQSALSQFEQRFFSDIASKLSDSTKQSIDELINTPKNPQGPDLK